MNCEQQRWALPFPRTGCALGRTQQHSRHVSQLKCPNLPAGVSRIEQRAGLTPTLPPPRDGAKVRRKNRMGSTARRASKRHEPAIWCGFGALCWSLACARPAHAYRPFDGTDAGVAETGQFELELGPANYYRAGDDVYLIAPDTVLNLGILPRVELVCNFRGFIAEQHYGDGSRASLRGTDLLLKWVAREGELQGKTGLSVALEGGALTPELGGNSGFGAQLAGIVSKQWPALALHFNEQVAVTRTQELDLLSGLILEGPQAWPARPVSELFVERTAYGPVTRSVLIGIIWPAAPTLVLDTGLRSARENQRAALEFRLGFTWSIGIWHG